MQTPQKQHSRRKRLEVCSTGGFWLLVGALLLAASLRFLLWAVLAAAVHELGHVLAIRALGGRVTRLQLTGLGAVLRTRRAGLCSYREECLVALAGPLASFLLALGAGTWARVFGGADAYLLTGISLALGVFNLLPAGPLDGGRVLRAVAAWLVGPQRSTVLWTWVTRGLGVGLLGLGIWALAHGGSFPLLVCALWLLWPGRRR